jgi:hypothetical protein
MLMQWCGSVVFYCNLELLFFLYSLREWLSDREAGGIIVDIMRGEELQELQKKYRDLPDEVLLDFIRNQADEFLPEALELIQGELRHRGYKEEEIALPRPGHEDEGEVSTGPLVKVAGCNDGWIARQAQDILLNEGITCFIDDSQMLADPFAGLGNHAIQIMVDEKDLARARELLDAFPPLHADSE